MTKAERREEIDAIKMVANEVINSLPLCPKGFNHGFLWAVAKIDGKNIKFLIGSGCPESWIDVELAVKKALPEIQYTNVRLD